MDQSLDVESLGVVHHFGIAVEDISAASITYVGLGFKQESEIYTDHNIGVSVQFFTQGENRIELVAPLSETSPAIQWLKVGSPIYHIAFRTADAEASRNAIRKLNFRAIYGPTPAVAFSGSKVEFFMNKNRLMIELIYDFD